MITFLTGIFILLLGGYLYSKLSARLFKPGDSPTPAYAQQDGVDFVPMSKWRNCFVNLLNIAGTGPVLGPIQGILFGPIAFLTIPIGCVLGGAVHDFWCGMISVRSNGEQMPALVKRFLGRGISRVYLFVLLALLLLGGVVFVYTPGDLFVGQIIGLTAEEPNYTPVTILVFAVIFAYYIAATMLPIDKIIGKIYPVFGFILFASALAVFVAILIGGATGKYVLNEIWAETPDWAYTGLLNPDDPHYIPTFFVTVACGIVSGFHSSQVTLVSRTLQKERDGTAVFYGMMCVEGFIAMCWAAGAMVVYNLGQTGNATQVVGLVSKEMLSVFWPIPVVGVIILPITSGDTAFRAVRILIQDAFKLKKTKLNNLLIALGIFTVGTLLLVWAKTGSDGFNVLWRYFGFSNQVIAVFSFAVISVYMLCNGKPFLMGLLPGTFYLFTVTSFILHEPIGFGLANWNACYGIAGVMSAVYFVGIYALGRKRSARAKLLPN